MKTERVVRARAARSSGVVIPRDANWLQRLVARGVVVLEGMLVWSLRLRWDDRSGFFKSPAVEPVIFCLWHNRLALSMAIFRKYVKRCQPERRLAALVSASKDGALLARILENFGVQPVRGSSSRRGAQGLLELTTWAEQRYDLAITPDGPRGPCGIVQEGVVALAQLTGRPIVPVICRTHWKIQLRSWDRFQLPLPFSRCEILFGPPMTIKRDATDDEREAARQQLQRILRDDPADNSTPAPVSPRGAEFG